MKHLPAKRSACLLLASTCLVLGTFCLLGALSEAWRSRYEPVAAEDLRTISTDPPEPAASAQPAGRRDVDFSLDTMTDCRTPAVLQLLESPLTIASLLVGGVALLGLAAVANARDDGALDLSA